MNPRELLPPEPDDTGALGDEPLGSPTPLGGDKPTPPEKEPSDD